MFATIDLHPFCYNMLISQRCCGLMLLTLVGLLLSTHVTPVSFNKKKELLRLVNKTRFLLADVAMRLVSFRGFNSHV